MEIEYDENKRRLTLASRGLDFARAPEVLESSTFDLRDDRFDYGEERYLTFGELDGRAVVVVWTPRGERTRIISMRHARDDEIENRRRTLD